MRSSSLLSTDGPAAKDWNLKEVEGVSSTKITRELLTYLFVLGMRLAVRSAAAIVPEKSREGFGQKMFSQNRTLLVQQQLTSFFAVRQRFSG